MARYIDAEELCRRINECWETNDIDKGRVIQQVIDRVITPIIVGTPTADVVEVVRCRDCKRCYEKRTKRNKQLMRFCMRMDGNEYQVNANDFCSYGERRTDDDTL